MPIKIVADDSLRFSTENKAWTFMHIVCLADYSHVTSNFIFCDKAKNIYNYDWHFEED